MNLANERIPVDDLEDISNLISYQQHNRYTDCWTKYPKSRKRYSKFNVEDLDQPYIQIEILSLLKRKYPDNYLNFSTILLDKNKDEIIELIKKQKEFQAMF